MAERDNYAIWLAKNSIDEVSIQYRTAWDLYIKFYTVFMTFNATALGITIQYVTTPLGRGLIAALFVFQNIVSIGTAYNLASYSKEAQTDAERFAAAGAALSDIELPAPLKVTPIKGYLGWRSGLASAISHVFFALVWVGVMFIPYTPTSK